MYTRLLDKVNYLNYSARMINIVKDGLRKKLLLRRHSLSKEKVAEQSAMICQRIRNWQLWKDASCVHIYVSGRANEVDTIALIKDCFGSGKRVFVPYLGLKEEMPLRTINVGQHAMAVIEIFCLEELVDEYWGIPQPAFDAGKNEINWNEIDLVIVPGLAFDQSGNRIGYGAGYYDRFLTELKTTSVGLCFKENVFDILPHAMHDISVEYVVTESAIYDVAS